MERDFMGISGREPAVKEGTGFLGSPPVNWPFSNKIPAMQQFMNFKAAQEEIRAKKIVFDHLSSSGFQPMPTLGVFDAMHRSPSVLASQKYLGIDRQCVHQFQQSGYPALGPDPFSTTTAHHSNEVRMFPAVSHHSIPMATSTPFFKASGSANGPNLGVTSLKQQQHFIGGSSTVPPAGGAMTAAFASRDTTKPSGTAAQLTIFYAGMVNVYDDVPLEKAQAIMFLAANGTNINSNVASIRTHIPAVVPTKLAEDEAISMSQTKIMNQVQAQTNTAQPGTKMCTPISTTPHGEAQPGSGHSSTDDLTGTKITESPVPKSQHEPPKAIVTAASVAGANFIPRAIPQARKASLARFLEKRKERVTIAAPYPPPQKSPECTSEFDGKSMTAETAHSSSKEQSWRPSAHKNSSINSNTPSTKLEIYPKCS